MKIFRTAAIKELDAYTIEHEPIASIDLMERAACTLTDAILSRYAGCAFAVFAGPGNNGGDGLAVARMLVQAGCDVQVWFVNPKGRLSSDCAVNLERLVGCGISVTEINNHFSMPALDHSTIILDALFGSGLNKPVNSGIFADVIRGINASGCRVVSVDMPSGLMGEENTLHDAVVIKAFQTLTLQFPKLSLLMPENAAFTGEMQVLDIGLSKEGMEKTTSCFYYTDEKDIKPLLRHREKHSHKGDYGRALLVAGSKGMAGASVLAARAALRSGLGLLTVHVPACNNTIVQITVPEAMTNIDSCDYCFSDVVDTSRYDAVAIGPGLGQYKESEEALLHLIDNCRVPMVIDADALNILARNPEYISRLPQGSIMTPHPGEFARIASSSKTRQESIDKALSIAVDNNVCIVLKGAYTAVISPDGNVFINSTGNPGMATGGSGDALTGIILSLLAQGYSSVDAARIGVYIHGLAGDCATKDKGETSIIASDIVDFVPVAFKKVK